MEMIEVGGNAARPIGAEIEAASEAGMGGTAEMRSNEGTAAHQKDEDKAAHRVNASDMAIAARLTDTSTAIVHHVRNYSRCPS